jgi:hypothetical protein
MREQLADLGEDRVRALRLICDVLKCGWRLKFVARLRRNEEGRSESPGQQNR